MVSAHKQAIGSLDEIGAVLFDFGGTLYHVDFDEVRLAQSILTQLGKRHFPRQEVEHALGFAEQEFAEIMISKHSERVVPSPTSSDWIEFNKSFLKALGIKDPKRLLSTKIQERWDDFWVKTPPAQSVFTARHDWQETFDHLIERSIKLGVISNTSVDLRPWLEKDKISPYLSVIVQSYEFGKTKPNPSIFHYTCDCLSMEPQQCVYVGDHYHYDILGAYNAGLIPIMIIEGNNLSQIPQNPPFQYNTVHSLTEIIDLLPSSSGPQDNY